MPDFRPFRAVRYNLDRVDLGDVVAPPYDVIDPEERARLEARSPYNVVSVDLTADYDSARCTFDEWHAAGVLVTDDEPGFYLYRMGWRDAAGALRQTTGVLGALALDPDRTGSVLPHERTMAKPLGDRLRLLRSCRTDLSPIWAMSMAEGLSDLCQPEGPPLARCTDDDGVHHRLWRVTAPAALDALRSMVASAPAVIADGHHRYETSLAYRAEQREANGGEPGPYDFVLTYLVELSDGQLGVRPIHRLLSGLPESVSLHEVLADAFHADAVPVTHEQLVAEPGLAVVEPGRAWMLRPKATAEAGDSPLTDAERLETALPALAEHAVAFHHDPRQVVALVDKGDADAAVLLRAPTVGQIAAAARAGRRLPQKTTFFIPKPRTGLVFRRLAD
ncbi:MAG: DUF1015 family protein [Acidimicrobiales bacterium]